MKFLILGKGYIGKKLFDYLTSQKHDVSIVSREELNYGGREYFYQSLINNKGKTKSFPDTIINTAGFTGKPNVDECELKKAKCYELNAILPKDIEIVCKELDIDFIHISSGCIYTGYKKHYTEEDEPNFGLFDNDSSFYSKTKHAGEIGLDKDFTNIIRIRMPIEDTLSNKNLLSKLLKYENLIDYKNSKTDVYTLCEFVETVADNFKAGIYNAVHSNALSTKEVTEIMKKYNLYNSKWSFVEYKKLDIKCNRSNCILTNKKAKEDFGFDWGDEEYYIEQNCKKIRKIDNE